jgi:aminopeptidase N
LDGPEVHDVTVDGSPSSFRLDDGALVVRGVPETAEVRVRYTSASPAAGLYFVGPKASAPDRDPMAWTQCQDEDAHFFMPCLDHPRIKHPWTIELEGPADCTLLSNGRCVADEVRDGWHYTRWEQDEPMPAYLFTAVVAKLEVVEDQVGDLALRYLVPRGRRERAMPAMGRTGEMVTLFESKTGVAFPWPRYDQVVVHDFVFGGMENVACTTMTEALLIDERVGPHWDPDTLVAHELAHQWFGDLVTCRDWSQAWLNESFATFMELVWMEHAHTPEEASWYAFSMAEAYLEEDAGRYRRTLASYGFREPIDMFDRHLYEKGAAILMTLRSQVGACGFWRGVGHYLTENAYGTVHGRDLQVALEDATGLNLDRFFQDWVHGAGHPDLSVKLGVERDVVTVAVTQRQSGEKTPEVYHLSLPLEVQLESGETKTFTLPIRERERAWAVPVDGEVRSVRVDPAFTMLATISLDAPTSWLRELAFDASPTLAVRALRALAGRGTVAGRRILEEVLSGASFWGVRAEAAKLLAKLRELHALPALIARLDAESEPRALLAVVQSLGTLQPADGVTDALVATLTSREHTWHVTGALLMAIGMGRAPGAADTLRGWLDTPSWNNLVRQKALLGLAKTRDAAVLADVLPFAEPEQDDRLVAAAVNALGLLGDRVPEVRRDVRERLEQLAPTGSFRVRLAAIAALKTLGDAAAVPALSRVHGSDPDGRVRRTAYEALVKLRQGRTSEEGLSSVRSRLDELAKENAELRMRVRRLEPSDV